MAKHAKGSRTIGGGDHLRTQHPINFVIPYQLVCSPETPDKVEREEKKANLKEKFEKGSTRRQNRLIS